MQEPLTIKSIIDRMGKGIVMSKSRTAMRLYQLDGYLGYIICNETGYVEYGDCCAIADLADVAPTINEINNQTSLSSDVWAEVKGFCRTHGLELYCIAGA